MRKRKQQVMVRTLIVNKRSSVCREETRYFDPIPIDVMVNYIFSRLSLNTMGKCRCVSKLWSSIIRPPNYKQLTPTKSSKLPRLLFTFSLRKKLLFYTSPQPQSPDENSPQLVANYQHMDLGSSDQISRPVHGLVCHRRLTGDDLIEFVISNPITRQYLALPKMAKEVIQPKSYLGYDPIEKQFKVLSISSVRNGTRKDSSLEYQVLTLENGGRNLLWRKIECCLPFHDLSDDGICINGVLYYTSPSNQSMIGCFDVRSEKFDFVTRTPFTTMINYEGELCMVDYRYSRFDEKFDPVPRTAFTMMINYKDKLGMVDYSDDKDFVLWVLEDSKEHKWSKPVYEKPLQWQRINPEHVYASGVIDIGEIVFCLLPKYATRVPFCIYYHNLEKNTVVEVRVQVPSFEGFKRSIVHTFANYVEDVKLI